MNIYQKEYQFYRKMIKNNHYKIKRIKKKYKQVLFNFKPKNKSYCLKIIRR